MCWSGDTTRLQPVEVQFLPTDNAAPMDTTGLTTVRKKSKSHPAGSAYNRTNCQGARTRTSVTAAGRGSRGPL